MHPLGSFDEDAEGTVFRDVILLALAGFLAVLILLLPHIAEPGVGKTADVEPPGSIMVEAHWPDGLDADVDLWVQAPGDVPVGYSNKGGLVFNLLRDDLGARADATEINSEISYGRSLPVGEYTVNLHLYRDPANVFPIPVTVVVSVRPDPKGPSRQILMDRVTLDRVGLERTVFRFRLDDRGRLVPGSVSRLPKPLRSAGRS